MSNKNKQNKLKKQIYNKLNEMKENKFNKPKNRQNNFDKNFIYLHTLTSGILHLKLNNKFSTVRGLHIVEDEIEESNLIRKVIL